MIFTPNFTSIFGSYSHLHSCFVAERPISLFVLFTYPVNQSSPRRMLLYPPTSLLELMGEKTFYFRENYEKLISIIWAKIFIKIFSKTRKNLTIPYFRHFQMSKKSCFVTSFTVHCTVLWREEIHFSYFYEIFTIKI